MTIAYKKLIRDNVPQMVEQHGQKPVLRSLDDEEFRDEIFVKLLDETSELIEAKDQLDTIVEKIGEVYEVIDTIMSIYKLDRNDIMAIKEQIKDERGAFQKKLFLEYVVKQ